MGTVTDPSGAAIRGATVTVRNVETGLKRHASTDEAGRFNIAPVAIGRYTLLAEYAGFRKTTVSDIALTIGQIGRVDVVLEVGQLSEQVEVKDTVALLQAEQASVGSTVEHKKIIDLPLNGRDFAQLVALTPGASDSCCAWETGNPQVLISGQRATETTSTIDGVLNIDQLFQGFPISPSVDAIEEFRVQSGNFSAEQGMGPSNVAIRLKSGTGNLLFLGACAGSAFYNTYCKLLIERKYTELEVLVYTSVVASVCSIPLFLWIEPLNLAAVWGNRSALWGILELALVVYGCSMLLFFSILKRLDVTQATLSNYVLPFFIGLLAVVVLKESFSPLMILGGGVVFVSTLIVTVYEGGILAWLAQRKAANERQ